MLNNCINITKRKTIKWHIMPALNWFRNSDVVIPRESLILKRDTIINGYLLFVIDCSLLHV